LLILVCNNPVFFQ